MEKYLTQGIQSILRIKNPIVLDVIIVNDGSQDCTLELARDFECKYPGIVTVVDKENGNYGSCINVGLKLARGRYVKILDADDYYVTENFELLVDVLSNTDADMFFTDVVKEYMSGKEVQYNFDLPIRKIVDIKEVCNSNAFIQIQMPAITYRTSLLKTMNYHQTEGISYTDLEWCFSPVIYVKTVYYLNVEVYRYRLGREGQTMDTEVLYKRISHTIKSFSSMLHSVQNASIPMYLENFINSRLLFRALYIYDFYLLNNKKKDYTALHVFDTELRKCNSKVYALCGNHRYNRHIPYYYITKWREGRTTIPRLVKMLAMIFDTIGKLRLIVKK